MTTTETPFDRLAACGDLYISRDNAKASRSARNGASVIEVATWDMTCWLVADAAGIARARRIHGVRVAA